MCIQKLAPANWFHSCNKCLPREFGLSFYRITSFSGSKSSVPKADVGNGMICHSVDGVDMTFRSFANNAHFERWSFSVGLSGKKSADQVWIL